MDTQTKLQLIAQCKQRNIIGYSGKNKDELRTLLSVQENTIVLHPQEQAKPVVNRLNYIGSKYKLLDWIETNILEKTKWPSFHQKRIADLFAGTGIVSYHFRLKGAIVSSNDAELYSAFIAHAFTRSVYSEKCQTFIQSIQTELTENKHIDYVGFITEKYSPYNGNDRKFFTVDNAKRIDYIRNSIESKKEDLLEDEYKFLVASLLLSADHVSNVPAVYGCFLKNFKAKALQPLILKPIHTNILSAGTSSTTNSNVLDNEYLQSVQCDLAYLDPPYNGRQYSKNYFPLNMIAYTPEQQSSEPPLKGLTGIPENCFMSPFCKKGEIVEQAFETLFRNLNAKWIFLSYSNESTLPKEKILELMKKYGEASVIECEYKRFKSYEYNKDNTTKEYLFCLEKRA